MRLCCISSTTKSSIMWGWWFRSNVTYLWEPLRGSSDETKSYTSYFSSSLKYSRAISRVNVELETEVSDVSSVSFIRVDKTWWCFLSRNSHGCSSEKILLHLTSVKACNLTHCSNEIPTDGTRWCHCISVFEKHWTGQGKTFINLQVPEYKKKKWRYAEITSFSNTQQGQERNYTA